MYQIKFIFVEMTIYFNICGHLKKYWIWDNMKNIISIFNFFHINKIYFKNIYIFN